MLRIGTAGWNVPSQHHRGDAGSHLERYARVFNAMEINSSFHRPHREATWRRWAESVPDGFQFSVKAPKTITHEKLLVDAEADLTGFLTAVRTLGEKLGVLLFQLPPSLAFHRETATAFLEMLRSNHAGHIALEPRHTSWFDPAVDTLLARLTIARVAADPPKGSPLAAQPGGDTTLTYWRLHGSPCMYYSSYEDDFLQGLAQTVRDTNQGAWVLFDNTAHSHAFGDALRLRTLVEAQSRTTC